RKELHRSAAEAIEAGPAQERDQALALLAHHWEQGGRADKAGPYYLAAARHATERYAYEDAERLYRGYFRLVEEPSPESIAARNELGDKVLQLQGRNQEALREHEQALSEARRLGVRALEGESLLALGLVCRLTGRMDA